MERGKLVVRQILSKIYWEKYLYVLDEFTLHTLYLKDENYRVEK